MHHRRHHAQRLKLVTWLVGMAMLTLGSIFIAARY